MYNASNNYLIILCLRPIESHTFASLDVELWKGEAIFYFEKGTSKCPSSQREISEGGPGPGATGGNNFAMGSGNSMKKVLIYSVTLQRALQQKPRAIAVGALG